MHRERDRVSDIIRQEFADRLVTTDEENKRVKNEMSEMKARHRIELDRCKEQMEDVRKQKDEEMEEVHKRWGPSEAVHIIILFLTRCLNLMLKMKSFLSWTVGRAIMCAS